MTAFPVKSMHHREQGAALLVAMIVLLALSLAGIAAMYMARSDTEIAGNLRFREIALNQAEAGLRAGGTWLLNQTTAPTGSTISGFYDRDNLPRDSNGGLTIDWNLSSNYFITTANGQTVKYIIEDLGISDAASGNSVAVGSEYGGGVKGTGALSQNYYRVTSRVEGPRNTVVVLEAIYAMNF